MNFFELYLAITLALTTSQLIGLIIGHAYLTGWFFAEDDDA